MTQLYGGNLASMQWKFMKESDNSIIIEDRIEINNSTKNITLQFMTLADVIPVKNGAFLKPDGKAWKLEILSSDKLNISVVALNPPPLVWDKRIENLKRIEIRVPACYFKEKKGIIKVRFSVDE